MNFLAVINNNSSNISKLIETFVNPFFDIALTSSDSSLNSFSTSTCFVSFEVTFLFTFLVYY